ncbi:hypothetical protein JZ785_23850 [Alicyclobacillus curvatus]|nr:hypothetical protein JZ785_23850 [Alicyclobacillus curvatus]
MSKVVELSRATAIFCQIRANCAIVGVLTSVEEKEETHGTFARNSAFGQLYGIAQVRRSKIRQPHNALRTHYLPAGDR